MKKQFLFRIAAASIICMSAFASVGAATSATAQATSSPSLYCWKSKLYSSGDNLVCNWAATTTEACKGNPTSELGKSTIATEPTDVRRCENGQQLVQATKK